MSCWALRMFTGKKKAHLRARSRAICSGAPGITDVIMGHSEQRALCHQRNETVNKKVKASLKAGLRPIVCAAETLAEREAGHTEAVVKDHVEGAYQGLSKRMPQNRDRL